MNATGQPPADCRRHRSYRRPPWLALAALGLALVGGAWADQFVLVEPGWMTTEQWSWTAAWGDYDNDGFVDLFVPNTGLHFEPWFNFLYHNDGDGTFTQQTADVVGPIASDENVSVGAYWGDFDNDGWLDLFVHSIIIAPGADPVVSRLYMNGGDGTFAEVNAGDLSNPHHSYSWAALADYDNDRCLDIFIPAAWDLSGHRTNLLFHGGGDGTFTLTTNNVVATDQVASSFSNDATWADFDNDGDADLLLANGWGHDFFYRNDGHGQFTRLHNSLLDQSQSTTASWHHAWGDYDNDGFLDVAQGCWDRTRLFRNLAGTGGDFRTIANWYTADAATPAWADYDNDGNLDLLAIQWGSSKLVRLLRNQGNGTFEPVEDAFTQWVANWIGGGWGDYDNDGFMDLFLAETTGQNQLYRNTGNTNHWLKLRLEGTVANRTALGAKVRVKATIRGKPVWQMREVFGGNCCQNDLRPNFGLGDATQAETVRIEWPSGTVTEFTSIAADRVLAVTEPPRLEMTTPGVLEILCWKGQKFEVQAAPDLSTWTPLGILTNETGTLTHTDPDTGTNPLRYYRVVAK